MSDQPAFENPWPLEECIEHVLNPHAAGVSLKVARKIAEELVRLRSRAHHEVLCLVLKELVSSNCMRKQPNGGGWVYIDANELVRSARLAADLAYPPPKAEGT